MTDLHLMSHQNEVLNKTDRFNRVAYYLDMGLGKTFVGSEKMWCLNAPVNLLICQKSKIDDWIQHFTEYYPDYKVYDLTHKTQSIMYQRYMDGQHIENDESVLGVINYELAFRRSYIAHIRDFTLMLDESQYIQNETAKRSKFVLSLKPKNVILLSGTPTSGKYEKLWSQCRLLGWDISKDAFWNTYIETEWVEDMDSGFKRQTVIGYKNVERLKRKLAQHGAVFMKTEEAFELPEQQEIVIRVPASKHYKRFMKNSYLQLDDVTELVGDTVLTKFLYARQLCGQYCPEKLEAVADLITSTDDRIVIFYNFTAEYLALVQIAEELQRPQSIVNGKQKQLLNYENFENSVTFVQYQAGAMGLNLQKAHITIYFTLPFGKGSCSLWEQSKKRTHRIGQGQKCLYYYPLCKGTIEEKNLINLRLGKEYNEKLFEKEGIENE